MPKDFPHFPLPNPNVYWGPNPQERLNMRRQNSAYLFNLPFAGSQPINDFALPRSPPPGVRPGGFGEMLTRPGAIWEYIASDGRRGQTSHPVSGPRRRRSPTEFYPDDKVGYRRRFRYVSPDVLYTVVEWEDFFGNTHVVKCPNKNFGGELLDGAANSPAFFENRYTFGEIEVEEVEDEFEAHTSHDELQGYDLSYPCTCRKMPQGSIKKIEQDPRCPVHASQEDPAGLLSDRARRSYGQTSAPVPTERERRPYGQSAGIGRTEQTSNGINANIHPARMNEASAPTRSGHVTNIPNKTTQAAADKGTPAATWTEEQDAKLISIKAADRSAPWQMIMTATGKTKDECRARWKELEGTQAAVLETSDDKDKKEDNKPSKKQKSSNSGEWTDKQDKKLLGMKDGANKSWSKIATAMNKTEIELKKHYGELKKKAAGSKVNGKGNAKKDDGKSNSEPKQSRKDKKKNKEGKKNEEPESSNSGGIFGDTAFATDKGQSNGAGTPAMPFGNGNNSGSSASSAHAFDQDAVEADIKGKSIWEGEKSNNPKPKIENKEASKSAKSSKTQNKEASKSAKPSKTQKSSTTDLTVTTTTSASDATAMMSKVLYKLQPDETFEAVDLLTIGTILRHQADMKWQRIADSFFRRTGVYHSPNIFQSKVEEANVEGAEILELTPDKMFSAEHLALLARLLREDQKYLWARVSDDFLDMTGDFVHPDDFEKKFTGRAIRDGKKAWRAGMMDGVGDEYLPNNERRQHPDFYVRSQDPRYGGEEQYHDKTLAQNERALQVRAYDNAFGHEMERVARARKEQEYFDEQRRIQEEKRLADKQRLEDAQRLEDIMRFEDLKREKDLKRLQELKGGAVQERDEYDDSIDTDDEPEQKPKHIRRLSFNPYAGTPSTGPVRRASSPISPPPRPPRYASPERGPSPFGYRPDSPDYDYLAGSNLTEELFGRADNYAHEEYPSRAERDSWRDV